MPEQVIQEIMKRKNPRTGKNYTRQEAESLYYGVKGKYKHSLTVEDVKHGRK